MPRVTRSVAAQALTLRRWALALLAGAGEGREEAAARSDACAPEAWDLFLGVERCALPLRAALRQPGGAGISAAGRRALTRFAAMETSRLDAARAQIRVVAAAAEEAGARAVALKGGAAVAAGADLDVGDLDVLVEEPRARAVEEVLRERGYRSTGGGSFHHLAPLVVPGGLLVELHLELPGMDVEAAAERVRPLDGVPGLWRLHPADQLWHVLLHCTVHHPERRGNLRDLLLVARAIAECSRDDLRHVEARVDLHPAGSQLAPVLAAGAALHAASARTGDPFREVAAANYLIAGQVDRFRRFPAALSWLLRAVHGRVGPAGRGALRRDPGWGLHRASGLRGVAWLERRNPALGQALRGALREAPLAAMVPVAWAVARSARDLAAGPTPRG